MQRDLRRLADDSFDLVIVGAGIYGALAAWDAALRGLSVAIIDRGDFGSGTSFNAHKTLHGGLRSLQLLNLKQMRLFIRERRAMARLAPHLVQPLPYCVPTYRHPTRNAMAMRAALAVNDVIASDRNTGIADSHLHLPRGQIVSKAECTRLNPLIDPSRITGGAVWFDYQMRQTERVVMGALHSAVLASAKAANYVEARSLLRTDGRVAGVAVVDRMTGAQFGIRARTVLNAAGPWAGNLLATLTGGTAAPATARLSRAMNIVVDRVTGTHACGGIVHGRYLFMVPWRDVSILGTSHDPHEGDADAPHGTPTHVDALLADARVAFPNASLDTASIRLVHRGLLPMVSATRRGVSLLKESAVLDHAREGHAGLLSMFGVRYTTARHTACSAVDAVCGVVGRPSASGLTDGARIAEADYATVAELISQARAADSPHTTADLRERLANTYGSSHREVAALIADVPGLARPLSDTCSITRAEIVHAVRHEAALTLADALTRRTEAGSAGHPGQNTLQTAAGVMGAELGWSPERIAREIGGVNELYPVREN